MNGPLSGAERALDVLVVEDNPVNQKVVVSLLTKWGHRSEVACDGARGLEAFARRAFDLVLMDIQMPVMDGLQATRSIRARELEHGGHTPIIAITAHARSEDRARCLDAGVDLYLTKPMNSSLLRGAIAELFPSIVPEPEPALTPVESSPVDFGQLKEFIGDDPELLADVIGIFLDEAPIALAKAHSAIHRGDRPGLEHAAHSLKGSLATMGAAAAAADAARLEAIGKNGPMSEAAAVYEQVHREVLEASECMRAWKIRLNAE